MASKPDSASATLLRTVLLSVSLVIAIVLLSPALLLLLGNLNVDWNRMSAIGQSYTGAATLLSGAALLGIIVTIRQQATQTAIMQGQATRSFQNELLRMAMTDPLYASVVPVESLGSSDHDTVRRFFYVTQWMRYIEFSYLSGDLGPAEANFVLHNFLRVADNRAWWKHARAEWVAAGLDNPRIGKLIALIDGAFDATSPPAAPPTAPQ